MMVRLTAVHWVDKWEVRLVDQTVGEKVQMMAAFSVCQMVVMMVALSVGKMVVMMVDQLVG